jgi:hypothetical protein
VLQTQITHTQPPTPTPQKRREDDVELYPPCHEVSSRIAAALKHVMVLCSTGQGKLEDLEVANTLMR